MDSGERLSQAGFPALTPDQFRAWSRTHSEALKLQDAAVASRQDANLLGTQLETARDRLVALSLNSVEADDPLSKMLENAEKILGEYDARLRTLESDRAELKRLQKQSQIERGNFELTSDELSRLRAEWESSRASAGISLEIGDAETGLDLLDELVAAEDRATSLERRIQSIRGDEDAFVAAVAELAKRLGVKAETEVMATFEALRRRLSAAQEVASIRSGLEAELEHWEGAARTAKADWNAAVSSVGEILEQCHLTEFSELPAAIEASRAARKLKEALENAEQQITSLGDGISIAEMASSWAGTTPDELALRSQQLEDEINDLNQRITDTANALGDARGAFESLESANRALARFGGVEEAHLFDAVTKVERQFTCFENKLEAILEAEIPSLQDCINEVRETFGISKKDEVLKSAFAMREVLSRASQKGHQSATLAALVNAIVARSTGA